MRRRLRQIGQPAASHITCSPLGSPATIPRFVTATTRQYIAYPHGMTARDEVLEAFAHIESRTGRSVIELSEVLDEVRRSGSTYRESTIRTHVSSRMCANAPDHHAVVYRDLERVGPGQYRRL
jgi:hypothetical protein